MELVTVQSEQRLLEMIPCIRENPDNWMSLRINLAGLHEQLLAQEGLSGQSLAKIHAVGLKMAKMLVNSELNAFEGKIMVFGDSDVLVLFLKPSCSFQPVLDRFRTDFARSGMLHLLVIEEMRDTLAKLISFSEAKILAAEEYRLKARAVEIGQSLLEWSDPDPELALAIQKKRGLRPTSCVLIIEDDILVRGLLDNMCNTEHQVVQAKNAESGIISYIDKAPNIVLLDINMPGLNGHETLKRLRALDPLAYVIMLSGDSSQDNVLSSRAHGAAGFLRKPFHREKLDEYVRLCPLLPCRQPDDMLKWHGVKDYFKVK